MESISLSGSAIITDKSKAHLFGSHNFGSTLTWSGSQLQLNRAGTHIIGVDEKGHDIIPPKGRFTLTLAITALVSVFGVSVSHGWNTGVMNAPSRLIQEFLNESYTQRFGRSPTSGVLNLLWSASVAIYLIGGCAGAFSAGWIANYFGRTKGLIVCNMFVCVSGFFFGFCQLANSFEMILLARIIVGFGCGAGSGIVPMYLTEIAPFNIRGAMGVLHQFGLTMGILLSNIFGLSHILEVVRWQPPVYCVLVMQDGCSTMWYTCGFLRGNENGWPILLALTAVPAAVSSIVLPFCEDSPRYLLVILNKEQEAEQALKYYRRKQNVHEDLSEMKVEYEQQLEEVKWTLAQVFKAPTLRLPFLLLCSMACCQQLSGINAVFYYSASVFEKSGIPSDKTQYAVLGTGLINVLMTAISVPLMEKSGRRPLLLGGMIIMVIAASLLTVSLSIVHIITWMSYISFFSTIFFIIGFAVGLGSIPQFIGAELFKQGPRPPAMSFAGFLNWLCNFTVGMTYPSMQSALQSYSFIVFIGIIAGFGLFLWWKLPETKHKSYQEIYDIFTNN